MLTPLQEHVARMVAALPQARGFALAGGAALIVRGIVTRDTNDLDFFGASAPDVQRLATALEDALAAEGFRVEPVMDTPGFVRLRVLGLDGATTVDLGTDARLQPAELTRLGEAITAEELAADKLLALFSRAQARDFVDVAALAVRFGGLDRLCELAAEKDAGFSRAVLAEMLGGFERLSRDEFPLDDHAFEDLKETVQQWRDHLAESEPPPP